ncbi:predicted protein [Scheffersomyces stipitis CBS 6054]|uniref:MICOS complex subunit MIC12 n=1 Tax=Scheffersomyces stipitis (strain ATCC 58785 / CBS 6054 / NBRC 10063 / NRRL Y-11545) TaxID=322104 RepID=A3LYY8_PICST|nr:predicted protein [Scheffersomyces stipitis CBS 6054]ABN68247.1 predicted protein [Scheffersomyces stipitis CBS 6054]KAG2731338.1 hypothetical protein G9P44_005754 [Scheffersomyces stipitis]
MGGRIHGFLGGVLLTSAFAYYTGEYIRKNEQFVSQQLRSANNIIQNKILTDRDLINESVPKSSHSISTQRVSVTETAKDIWNDEIIKMVNWVYSINWYQAGLTADRKVLEFADKLVASVSEKK